MSKFEELSKAFIQSRKEFNKSREACRKFAVELYDKTIDYFEILPSSVELVSISEDGTSYEPTIPMSNALIYLHEGFWYFGIGIAFGYRSEAYKSELTVLHILVKEENKQQFTVQLGVEGEGFLVDRMDSTSYERFFEHVYSETLQGFQRGLFLQQEEEPRKIGFKLE